jgi:hypothetical protein
MSNANFYSSYQYKILEYIYGKTQEFKPGLWIRIRIGSVFRDFVDPDPYWESGSGSRGKKTRKLQWKKCTF